MTQTSAGEEEVGDCLVVISGGRPFDNFYTSKNSSRPCLCDLLVSSARMHQMWTSTEHTFRYPNRCLSKCQKKHVVSQSPCHVPPFSLRFFEHFDDFESHSYSYIHCSLFKQSTMHYKVLQVKKVVVFFYMPKYVIEQEDFH